MSLLNDCWKEFSDNTLDFFSNYISPLSELVEIGCLLGSWIVFLIYFIPYAQLDITGYEYYDHKVLVFQGSGPRERVLDINCAYVENEQIGSHLVNYLYSKEKWLLICSGSIWLFQGLLIIIIFVMYFVLNLLKAKTDKKIKIYISCLKLFFDFIIPLIMIPIASIHLSDKCVTRYPIFFFQEETPLQISPYSSTVLVVWVIRSYYAYKYDQPLYTLFYASFKIICSNLKLLSYLLSLAFLLLFLLEIGLFILSNPLLILLFSLSSFILTYVRLVKECEEIIAIKDLHSALFSLSRSTQVKNLDIIELTQIQEIDFTQPLETEASFRDLVQTFQIKITLLSDIEEQIHSNRPQIEQRVQQQYLEQLADIDESYSIFFINLEAYQQGIRIISRSCWDSRFKLSNEVKDIRLKVLIQQFRILFLLFEFQKKYSFGNPEQVLQQMETKLAFLKDSRNQLCNSKWLFFWQLRNLKVDTKIKELTDLIKQAENVQNKRIKQITVEKARQ